MVHIPKVNRSKFDLKSYEAIMVGYSHTTKGYRVYGPSKRKVVAGRDVTFIDEGASQRNPLENSSKTVHAVPIELHLLSSNQEIRSSQITNALSNPQAIVSEPFDIETSLNDDPNALPL